MTILRSRQNPDDQRNKIDGPTDFKEGPNQFELHCGVCNGVFFVDEDTWRWINAAMQAGLDNPFCCYTCEGDYDDLAHVC